MILQYQSSDGQVFNLKSSPLRTRTANYHDYSWNPMIREQQYGERVYRFNKQAAYYTTVLDVSGSIAQRKQTLNELHAAFDRDIYNLTPGRIIHGEYYIECYVTFSSTGYNDPFTENELSIYCPYPFWVKEHLYQFAARESTSEVNEFLDYPYGFEYDFMSATTGQAMVTNEGAGPANFKLIFYGNALNPFISMDGATIGVNTLVGSNDRIEIDSHDHTVYLITNGDEKLNFYNARTKETSIFNKITSGEHSIVWPGTFGFELIIYEERSEPKWI